MQQYQSLDSRERGKLRLGRHGACGAIVDLIFGGFALIPSERKARVVEASITWNYTTWLNLAFLVLAGFLVRRFLNTGFMICGVIILVGGVIGMLLMRPERETMRWASKMPEVAVGPA